MELEDTERSYEVGRKGATSIEMLLFAGELDGVRGV